MRIHPLLLLPALSGCAVTSVAGTAVGIVTLPVKAVAAGVDAATTSQAEADQKRGRELRRAEEERGRQLRLLEQRCRTGRRLPADDCRLVQPR
jgi:hypothetical protein